MIKVENKSKQFEKELYKEMEKKRPLIKHYLDLSKKAEEKIPLFSIPKQAVIASLAGGVSVACLIEIMRLLKRFLYIPDLLYFVFMCAFFLFSIILFLSVFNFLNKTKSQLIKCRNKNRENAAFVINKIYEETESRLKKVKQSKS